MRKRRRRRKKRKRRKRRRRRKRIYVPGPLSRFAASQPHALVADVGRGAPAGAGGFEVRPALRRTVAHSMQRWRPDS